jgi:transposase
MGKSITDLSSVTTVGLDLAKHVFQVHGVDASGRVVVAKAIRRNKLSLPPCLVGLEASGSAHHWRRELITLGHEARMMPKTIAETPDVARSNLIERRDDARPKRGPPDQRGDLELSASIRRPVDQRLDLRLPDRAPQARAAIRRPAPINTKRVYRLTKKHGLLLERHTGRRRLREHRWAGGDDRPQRPLVLGRPRVHLLERRDGARRLRSR